MKKCIIPIIILVAGIITAIGLEQFKWIITKIVIGLIIIYIILLIIGTIIRKRQERKPRKWYEEQ